MTTTETTTTTTETTTTTTVPTTTTTVSSTTTIESTTTTTESTRTTTESTTTTTEIDPIIVLALNNPSVLMSELAQVMTEIEESTGTQADSSETPVFISEELMTELQKPSDTKDDSTQVPSIVCNQETFNDGICDEENNNEFCGFDGGDCCEFHDLWDSRCKSQGKHCKCKEPCHDDVSWCKSNLKWHCDDKCTLLSNGKPCWEVCKRTCSRCTNDTCSDIGTPFYSWDLCQKVKEHPNLCNSPWKSWCGGGDNCGDLCRKTCHKCTPPEWIFT